MRPKMHKELAEILRQHQETELNKEIKQFFSAVVHTKRRKR